MKFKILNNEIVEANSATGFVTALREGSYNGDTGDNKSYKVEFAERFQLQTGRVIVCPVNDDLCFIRELIYHGFIRDIIVE